MPTIRSYWSGWNSPSRLLRCPSNREPTPIRRGWAVVGRTDKFLSPAAVEVVSVSENELTIRMVESGPLAVWRGTSSPWSTGVTFTNAGNDLYMADLPVGERDRPVTIGR